MAKNKTANILEDLQRRQLLKKLTPSWLVESVQYLTIIGSVAYGVSDVESDMDIYGFCVPPKRVVFPHIQGWVPGFENQPDAFDQWQEHHIQDNDAVGGHGREYDFSVYNIVRYFALVADNNPNMIDSLFTPERCVLWQTPLAVHVRENRHLFLSKKCWHTFKGYAWQQRTKMKNRSRSEVVDFLDGFGLDYRDFKGILTAARVTCLMNGERVPEFEEMGNPLNRLEDQSVRCLCEKLLKIEKIIPDGKRGPGIERWGYDCYDEQMTEFLTRSGWKRFDEVADGEEIGTLDSSGQIRFQCPTGRVDKPYSGHLYTIDAHMTRCCVTERHRMLVSPAHRSPSNRFSYEYEPAQSEWSLVPLADLRAGSRSWYHIRRASEPRMQEYSVSDEYLVLAGLYISEGSISRRKLANGTKSIKSAHLCQTDRGNPAYFDAVDALMRADLFGLRRYTYKRKDKRQAGLVETQWHTDKAAAERLCDDFGRGSRGKRLPGWCYDLSYRQALVFWQAACSGDDTFAPHGDVYYSTSGELASDMQAMMVSAGHVCSLRGPFVSEGSFGEAVSYQTYLSSDVGRFRCVDLKSRTLLDGQEKDSHKSYSVKQTTVQNQRVVCFEVPDGVLVTRNSGRVAIQGNCKFAYHLVRLVFEIEQILEESDLDITRSRETLKAIRAGEWTEKQIMSFFESKVSSLEKLYDSSPLRWEPDKEAIKRLLLECLEMHYGSLDNCVVKEDEAVRALREIQDILDRNRKIL